MTSLGENSTQLATNENRTTRTPLMGIGKSNLVVSLSLPLSLFWCDRLDNGAGLAHPSISPSITPSVHRSICLFIDRSISWAVYRPKPSRYHHHSFSFLLGGITRVHAAFQRNQSSGPPADAQDNEQNNTSNGNDQNENKSCSFSPSHGIAIRKWICSTDSIHKPAATTPNNTIPYGTVVVIAHGTGRIVPNTSNQGGLDRERPEC